jgi:hypothetical protein
LNAIHIANNDGVTYENRNFQVIETRKDSAVHVSLSSSSLVKQPGAPKTPLPFLEGSPRPHSTANDNRLESAVDSLILVRSFTGTKTCLGQGPRQRRAQRAVYKPAQSALSTVLVNKSSSRQQNLALRRSPDFADSAPYLSHNPATFWHYLSIESPGDQWGLPAFNHSRDRRLK